jgi:hypothetical protein
VIVDGSHRLDGTTLGPYSMLKINTLFVGGSSHPLYKNRVDVNFKGCLKKVTKFFMSYSEFCSKDMFV